MQKIKVILGTLAIFAAVSFSSCENNTKQNNEEYNTGEAGDSLNNLNNGGNYSPDERNDNRNTETTNDSTVGTTGSKFDENGNTVTGNDDVNSNRQQDATTGNQSNTERQREQ